MSLAEIATHRFTWEDVLAMVRAGILDEDVELIEGELIDMPPEGPRHVEWSSALGFWLFRSLQPNDYTIVPGSTLVLSERNAPQPDYYVFPARLETGTVRGPDVSLAIEEADSSLRRDLGWKADLYARNGVRDYWVFELEAKRLHVHRVPRAGQYTDIEVYEAEQTAEALLIPGLMLRMADLYNVC